MNQPTSGMKRPGFNILMYLITIVVICVFVYFIYNYIFGASKSDTSIVLSGKISANTSTNPAPQGVYDIQIPNIYEGGEFSTNFWVYIAGYTVNQGQRKHILEIGHTSENRSDTNFSTMLIALGATTPTLLVRVHTKQTDALVPGENYGITDCSGDSSADCGAGAMAGFQQLTDKNLAMKNNKMMDNTLFFPDIKTFFTPYDACGNFIDENNAAFNSTNTCDIKEISMQKWVNISTVINGKTLDIYLDGKLVKTCVFNNYYKVDPTGTVASYLQFGGFDGYLSQLQIFNKSLAPDDIYKFYLAGPTGASATNDPVSFVKYLFTG